MLQFTTLDKPLTCNGVGFSYESWQNPTALFSGGIVIAAEAGSPAAALAVARSFLGREFTVNDSPTLTPDDKAIIHAKHGQRACSMKLVRRASVLSGWKISAQDCKPKTSKGAKRG